MRAAAEGPNPVQVALNNNKRFRPAVAEAPKKEAQLAQKSKKSNNNCNSKFWRKPRKKPRKYWIKRSRLLRRKLEKAVEAAKNNHAGCMMTIIISKEFF
jgi:hypothetical protein